MPRCLAMLTPRLFPFLLGEGTKYNSGRREPGQLERRPSNAVPSLSGRNLRPSFPFLLLTLSLELYFF